MQKDGYIAGTDSKQSVLFPDMIDDYITPDNPVRFIDAFVDALDLKAMSFTQSEPCETGRPPYNPGDELKLFIYGYLNHVRSSRKLERECAGNVEVTWLMRKLMPDFKTIADFRKENAPILKDVFRMLNSVCDEFRLFGKELIGVDGSKFRAVNSKNNCPTEEELEHRLRKMDERIEQYMTQMEESDAAESADKSTGQSDDTESMHSKLERLKAKKTVLQNALAELRESGEKRISLTDRDSRMMKDKDGTNVCHNVQIAVDSANRLIAEFEAVSDETDYNCLHSVSASAKEALDVKTIGVVADKGYHNYSDIKKCTDADIVPFVPVRRSGIGRRNPVPAEGFYSEDFRYDAAMNIHVCPAGNTLEYRYTVNRSNGISFMAYSTDACASCPLKQKCTGSPAGRIIRRRVEQDAVDAMNARMAATPGIMRKRSGLCEHPFGTIKRAFDSGYFLLRGHEKVNGELALMMTACNMRRLFTIVGVNQLLNRIGNRNNGMTPCAPSVSDVTT